MDHRSLSLEIHSLSKTIGRYLSATLPERARIATGGNAHIIMFLAHNRNRDIYQHNIEERFCITRSTASRVLALMEKKHLITRDTVESDARVKKISLTGKAEAIVEDLDNNATRMEAKLLKNFSQAERAQFEDYLQRLRENIRDAQNDQSDQNNQSGQSGQSGQSDQGDLTLDTTNTTKEEGK